ncbi:Hydrogenase maturation factor HybF [Anaerolineales bacterium]|nr:Hydrogenase maturation factor HybF [Anaerolineales bacterium]
MHEMSLAESVLQIIEDASRTRQFRRVRTVVLEIGALAAVEPEAMRFAFDAVVRGTLADGARLELIEIPGQGRCTACGMRVALQEQYGLCPECGSPRIEIVAGMQMRVKDLVVE